jgi:hypothetical protein
MAIIAHFQPKGLTDKTYPEVMRRLAAAGAGAPHGRLQHICYGPPEALNVVDVYATPQDLEAFARTLMPILASLGVDPGAPAVQPVTDMVRG